MAELPEIPLTRLFIFVVKELLSHELQRYADRLFDPITGGGLVRFEGLFNLVKASMVFTRTGEDVATIGMHFAPLRSGLIADTPASDAEMNLIAARLATLWDAIDGFYAPEFAYDRLVFHDAGPKVNQANGRLVGIDYDTGGKRVPGQPAANPALRTDTIGLPGTSAETKLLPPQVAATVTLKTAIRREWGRVYLVAPDSSYLVDSASHAAGSGQLTDGAADLIRTAFGDLLDGCSDDEIPMVIWAQKHQVALSVDTIQVDTLYDVVRSRRFDRPHHYATHTLGA